MNSENAIEVKNVKKRFKVYLDKGNSMKEKILFRSRNRYEDRWVLKGVSFDVKKGEAIGLIGKNGCGKSTTLKMLTRIMYPTEGTIELTGRVSSLIELGAGFHPDMSGRENIFTNASIFGLNHAEIERRLDDIIKFSELEEFIDNPVRTYSSGMYMRLAFAVAINVDADILLIDEILAVGDVSFQAKCFEKLKDIKRKGTTIVIVSHVTQQIKNICDRAIWIDEGVIREEGMPGVVTEHYLETMEERRMERVEEEFQKELNDSAVVSFEIPLTVNTTEIKMNYDLKNNVNEKFEYGKTSIIHPVLFVISLIVAIVDIIFLVWELIVYTVNKDDKVKYQEKLKKIFRDYGPYISKKAMTANTKEIMYTVSLRIEVVDSFDDLINVRDSIEKPILFYEAIPGEQSVFYIIDTKVSYIYIMNAKDCGKKSSKVADLDFAVVEDNKKLNNGDNLIGVEYKNIEKDYLEGIDVIEEKGENDLKKEEIIKKEENQEKNSESVLNEETMLEMTDDLCVPKKKKKKRKKKKQVSE